jgi:hypothetical protein
MIALFLACLASDLAHDVSGKMSWHGVWGCYKVIFASHYLRMDVGSRAVSTRKAPLKPERLFRFLHASAADLSGFGK